MKMSTIDLKTKIDSWENEYGESFYDYYAHDRINYHQWADFLESKGLKENAQKIRDEYEHEKKNTGLHYVDQETLFTIYPEYSGEKYSEENAEKNMSLLAEFIVSKESRLNQVLKWFEEQ